MISKDSLKKGEGVKGYYSAFTVAELGEMARGGNPSSPTYIEGFWWYDPSYGKNKFEVQQADTEANGRAYMVLDILRYGYIAPL